MSEAEPIKVTYRCEYTRGGPLDGAVIACNDLHDEAVPHAGGYAIYARVSSCVKRFIGFARDMVEGDRMCQRFRERTGNKLCGGM